MPYIEYVFGSVGQLIFPLIHKTAEFKIVILCYTNFCYTFVQVGEISIAFLVVVVIVVVGENIFVIGTVNDEHTIVVAEISDEQANATKIENATETSSNCAFFFLATVIDDEASAYEGMPNDDGISSDYDDEVNPNESDDEERPNANGDAEI